MSKIYFDNAATTKPAPEVIDSMLPFLNSDYGNASSFHSFGKTAKVLLEDTRDLLSDFLGAKPKEIFFTGSGTESNNMALKGIVFNNLDSGKKHIISSSIEHSSVYETLNYIKKSFGYDVTFIKPDASGFMNIPDIEKNICGETLLISIMHSNNETGILNDIKEISRLSHSKGIPVHTDSVQSIGKTKFNLKDLDVDFASVSAHKIYGPKGIGALYVNENIRIEKILHGGPQERNMRAGTENIPAIAGFKTAIELLKKNFEDDENHYKKLRTVMLEKLISDFKDKILINSPVNKSLPNILNVSFKPELINIDPEIFLILLDTKGIAVSGGSACTSGSLKPSRVLLELGRDEKTAMMSLRISFGRYNTLKEIDEFTEVLKNIIL